MTSSNTITKISAALVAAQSEMGNAKKDAMNPFFKKSYADLNAVREVALPPLNKNGISVLQPICVIDGVDFVETILLHISGEFISGFTRIISDKANDAQRQGSGLSYARRYGLQSILSIGAEDDDANDATSKTSNPAKSATPQSPKKSKLNEAGFQKLLDKLAAPGADIDSIVLNAREKLDLTDAQAELFVSKVAALGLGGPLPV